MATHRNTVSWPILEFLDQELETSESQPEVAQEAVPIPADAVFMAGCDVFLTRDGAHAFTLTLKHKGKVSEIRLTADVDETGSPSLLAFVA